MKCFDPDDKVFVHLPFRLFLAGFYVPRRYVSDNPAVALRLVVTIM